MLQYDIQLNDVDLFDDVYHGPDVSVVVVLVWGGWDGDFHVASDHVIACIAKVFDCNNYSPSGNYRFVTDDEATLPLCNVVLDLFFVFHLCVEIHKG